MPYVSNSHAFSGLESRHESGTVVCQAVNAIHLLHPADIAWPDDHALVIEHLDINQPVCAQVQTQQLRSHPLQGMLVRQVTRGFAEHSAKYFTVSHQPQGLLALAKFTRHGPAFTGVFYGPAQCLGVGPCLADVVLGACAQHAPAIFATDSTCQHHHRAYRHAVQSLERCQHFRRLHVRQIVIKHDAVRRGLHAQHLPNCRFSHFGLDECQASFAALEQHAPDLGAVFRAVVDDEDTPGFQGLFYGVQHQSAFSVTSIGLTVSSQ